MTDVKTPFFQVPKSHVASLALLLRASQPEFERFANSVNATKPSSNTVSLMMQAAQKAGWPKLDEAAHLGRMLVSLASMAESLPSMSLGLFVVEVARAAETQGETHLTASRDQWDVLPKRLGVLLGPGSPLYLSAKANGVIGEQERLFCEARILSDCRPIFDRRPSDGPIALAIVHTLKISYHRGGADLEEFFVALDTEDLQTLKSVILRAEEKQAALRIFAEKAALPLIPPTGE